MSEVNPPTVNSTGFSRHRAAQEAAYLLAICFEYLCADSGAPVNSIRFSQTDEGWLLTLKARSATKGGLVAFFGARSIEDCMALMMHDLYHQPGIKWKVDKYG